MKKISHEIPLKLLKESRQWNDYDYCLVHLLDKYPEYLQFYQDSLQQGRTVLLDNSIFELGTSFDPDKFAQWIVKLKPTEYIIPDALEDYKTTKHNLYNWLNKYANLPGKKIGVVQGKDYSELVMCYEQIQEHCDKIAISFDYSYYAETFPHKNKIISWCFGRVKLINDLLHDGILNTSKPHHLLGCSSPEEFRFYQDPAYNFIESIDTSNPIVHGLLNIVYPDSGLWYKERIKLVDLIESDIDISQKEIIDFNIVKFRNIVNL